MILPLLGVLYLRWIEGRALPRQPDTSAVFQQRDGERRITPPVVPAMPAAGTLSAPVPSPTPSPTAMSPLPAASAPPQDSGSLGFIKPSEDYFKDKAPSASPEPPKQDAKPASSPEPPKAAPPSTAKTKTGKKPFAMPKLNPGKGFTNFKRNQPGAEEPSDPAGGADMSEMLKNLPPGAANNPEIQKMLQQQGK